MGNPPPDCEMLDLMADPDQRGLSTHQGRVITIVGDRPEVKQKKTHQANYLNRSVQRVGARSWRNVSAQVSVSEQRASWVVRQPRSTQRPSGSPPGGRAGRRLAGQCGRYGDLILEFAAKKR